MKEFLYVKAILISLATGMMVAPLVMADMVTVYHVNGYDSGGEFTVKIDDNNLSPDLNLFWGVYSSNTGDIRNEEIGRRDSTLIWHLEDEQDSYGWHNPFATALRKQFGDDWRSAAKAHSKEQYPVMLLNLRDPGHAEDYNHRHQDISVCAPPPVSEPATMLLLGSGLIGLAGFARRKFRK